MPRLRAPLRSASANQIRLAAASRDPLQALASTNRRPGLAPHRCLCWPPTATTWSCSLPAVQKGKMFKTSGEASQLPCPHQMWFVRLLDPQPISLQQCMHSPTLDRAESRTAATSANRLWHALSLLTCLTFRLPRFCTTFCNRNGTPCLKP